MASKETSASSNKGNVIAGEASEQKLAQTRQQVESVTVAAEPKVVVSKEQHVASEIPLTQQKVVTKEFVPITHEKVITNVPIITEEKVKTGQAVGGQQSVAELGKAYLPQTASKIEVTPTLETNIPTEQKTAYVQETKVKEVPVMAEKVESHVKQVPLVVTEKTNQMGTAGYVGKDTLATDVAGFTQQKTTGSAGGLSSQTSSHSRDAGAGFGKTTEDKDLKSK